MSLVEKCALGLVLLFLLAACLRLLRQPLKLALRVLINSALGFCALWLLNMTTGLTGLSLGLNLFNALTIGVLGVPGLGLLLLLKWVLVEPRRSSAHRILRIAARRYRGAVRGMLSSRQESRHRSSFVRSHPYSG